MEWRKEIFDEKILFHAASDLAAYRTRNMPSLFFSNRTPVLMRIYVYSDFHMTK